MREIKFRGKLISDDFRTIYKDGWIYGDYLKNYVSHFIINEFNEGNDNSGYPSIDITFWQKVIPETVSQFTGLYDKNGKEIYEGDIVNCWGGEWVFGVWEYLEIIEKLDIREMYELTNVNWAGIEVVGNIHDNPELLKEQ